jgi:hypothetical protein
MFNELEDSQISLERALWMSVHYRRRIPAHRFNSPVTKRRLRRSLLQPLLGVDWANGIAFLVLAGSGFAGLIEFFYMPGGW